jgi:O-antigen/teichoic acid export membrane protein
VAPGLPVVSADLANFHIDETKGVAAMIAAGIGAVCFGLVVGWVTYRTLARRAERVSLSDIATVIGAVGGAGVVAIFDDKQLFGLYSIGLAVGFFGYLLVYVILNGRKEAGTIMGQGDTPIELNE